jgi:D-amino peptidase
MEKKIYISCDMEGCAGVTSWEQTHYGHKGWDSSPEEMMAGISSDYAGAIHIGSHSPAGSSETPLDKKRGGQRDCQ